MITNNVHRRNAVWATYARKNEGKFVDGGMFGVSELRVPYRDWELVLSGAKGYTDGEIRLDDFYKLTVLFKARTKFTFNVFREGTYEYLGKRIPRLIDFLVGEEDFDAEFVVNANERDKIKALLKDNALKRMIATLYFVDFKLIKGSQLKGAKLARDMYQLRLVGEGLIMDDALLVHLFKLFGMVLDRLVDIGVATRVTNVNNAVDTKGQPVAKEKMGANSRSREEVWQVLAAYIGGQFIKGTYRRSDCILYQHRHWQILLDTYEVKERRKTYTYTRMRVPLLLRDLFFFRIFSAKAQVHNVPLTRFANIVDKNVLGNKFVAQTNNRGKLKKLVQFKEIKALIQGMGEKSFQLYLVERNIGDHNMRGVHELYFETKTSIEDQQELFHLFQLFSYLLDGLVAVAGIYDTTPGYRYKL